MKHEKYCYHKRVHGQTLKWWHVRWGLAGRAIFRLAVISGKIVGSLCLVAAVCFGIFYLISPWLVSKQLAKVDPRLNMVPLKLSKNAEVPLSGASIDIGGFTLQLPHDGVVNTSAKERRAWVLFPNKGVLIASNTSRDRGIFSFVKNDNQAQKLLGQELTRSNFKLLQAVMSTTPEQVKWWRLRSSENQRAEYLLGQKFIAISQSATPHGFITDPIYSIASGTLRGFQIGDPGRPPYEAHLDLYDETDRHITIDLIEQSKHGQVFTQEEINSIVASIKPI